MRSFKTDDGASKAALIDKLYDANEPQKNRLTGKAGNTLNTLITEAGFLLMAFYAAMAIVFSGHWWPF